MHHFETDGAAMDPAMAGGQQMANGMMGPPGAPTFRQEYNNVINGLMSTVQLGFTGVSMIYFFQSMKTIFADFREKMWPGIQAALKSASPKVLLFYLYKWTMQAFKIQDKSQAVSKIMLALLAILALYIYFIIQRNRAKILEQTIREKKAVQTKVAITSEEFWHK